MKRNQRLKLSRQRAGFKNAAAAAKAMRIPYPTYAAHENGNGNITIDEVEKYAKFFNVTAAWLAYGEGEAKQIVASEQNITKSSTALNKQSVFSVPVRGVVQAGVWTEFEDFEDDSFQGVEIPVVPGKWEALEQFAFKVRGSSMDADRIHDGDFVVAVPYFDARSDLTHGDTVIVERKRSSAIERTVKIIEIDDGLVRFSPRSSDKRFKAIEVSISRELKEADDTEVSVIGLVIFVCQPR